MLNRTPVLFLFEHIEVDGVIGVRHRIIEDLFYDSNQIDIQTLHDWKLPDLKKIHAKWQTALPPLGAWNRCEPLKFEGCFRNNQSFQ